MEVEACNKKAVSVSRHLLVAIALLTGSCISVHSETFHRARSKYFDEYYRVP
jgi:hypothetical protein